ncbi:MAG: PP2C family serine/threonine-protein phosphatase [Ktedonobacteraceae bacterium]
MSPYSFVAKLRKGMGLYVALPLLSGILIALQLVLPSVAFASSTQSSYSFGSSQALDQASVSVVRLLVSYTAVPPISGCPTSKTGLGILVGSWATSPGSTTINNWVLTDGSLVNPAGLTCGQGISAAPLTTIQIYTNTAYAGSTTASTSVPSARPLASVECQPQSCSGGRIMCQISPTCSSGVVLVPFQTSVPQPFIDISSIDQATPVLGIELTGTSSLPPSIEQAVQFLAPAPASSLSAPNDELGMPIVNGKGQLVDMKSNSTAGSIRTFVSTQIAPTPVQAVNTNALHDAWNKGISDFYANHLTSAQTDFRNAAKPNPLFLAPSAFLKLPAFQGKGNTGTSGSGRSGTPSSGGTSLAGQNTTLFGITIPNSQVMWLVIGGVVLLVLLLLLLSLTLIRRQAQRRRELARFDVEQRTADQKAAKDAVRIAEQEKVERKQARQQPPAPMINTTGTPAAHSNLRCPNCGQPVLPIDKFCSNCRVPLSPAEAGLQGRAALSPSSPPPAPMQSPPAPGLVPAASIYDQPTREMSPSQFRNGQVELERTLPYTGEDVRTAPAFPGPPVEQFTGRNMSLVVGTRSNPGIKRQHKPNEDSLFAAQGERTLNSNAEQFGLFVVADGMGGHASGQDASRLAIQTIADRALPQLSGNEPLTDEALTQLLVDGVKEANLAVHQRNIQDRADMGTTMTAALIVGTTAYIANVGDSRTYLYRRPDGLKKITNDHSVVASLVEAGIIKPDDIYTHPKRNQIYRSLGEKPVIDVDSFTVLLQPGDKLLLCSDGLWDMVRDPTIEQILSTVPDPSQTGNALIKAALDGGGDDNVSVIVVHINEATQRTGMTGIQLLARPDSPQYPPM